MRRNIVHFYSLIALTFELSIAMASAGPQHITLTHVMGEQSVLSHFQFEWKEENAISITNLENKKKVILDGKNFQRFEKDTHFSRMKDFEKIKSDFNCGISRDYWIVEQSPNSKKMICNKDSHIPSLRATINRAILLTH